MPTSLQKIMFAQDYSLKKLSIETKLDYCNLSRIVHGHQKTSINNIYVIADALNCHPNELREHTLYRKSLPKRTG